MVAGTVAAGIGPLAERGLDEAFGLAVGLGAIRAGEAVRDAEVAAGVGEGVRAIAPRRFVGPRTAAIPGAVEGEKRLTMLVGGATARRWGLSSAWTQAKPRRSGRRWRHGGSDAARLVAIGAVTRCRGRRGAGSGRFSRRDGRLAGSVALAQRMTGGGAGSSALNRFKPWRLRIRQTVAFESGVEASARGSA